MDRFNIRRLLQERAGLPGFHVVSEPNIRIEFRNLAKGDRCEPFQYAGNVVLTIFSGVFTLKTDRGEAKVEELDQCVFMVNELIAVECEEAGAIQLMWAPAFAPTTKIPASESIVRPLHLDSVVTAPAKIDLPVLGGALRLKLRVNTWYEMYLSIDGSEVFLGASSQRELSDRLSTFLHEPFTPWQMILALSETYVGFYPVAIKPSGPQILMLQNQHGKAFRYIEIRPAEWLEALQKCGWDTLDHQE
jgi:hypothetical protein